jgi:hypothetical protein
MLGRSTTVASRRWCSTKAAKMADMPSIVSLCKRRGFVYPSSEIYNGYGGFFDYGPLGVSPPAHLCSAACTHI